MRVLNRNVLDMASNPRYSLALCATTRAVTAAISRFWISIASSKMLSADVIALIHRFLALSAVLSTANLGDGEKWHNGRFREIESLRGRHFVQIASGQRHSLLLEDDGTLLALGGNDFGQLGLGDDTDTQLEVQQVHKPTPIAQAPKSASLRSRAAPTIIWPLAAQARSLPGDSMRSDSAAWRESRLCFDRKECCLERKMRLVW